jgi:hypothetical protein
VLEIKQFVKLIFAKMKKLFLISIFLFSIIEITSAQETGSGSGVMLGEPSGLSGKYWLDDSHAVDFGIGTGLFGASSGLSVHADYLYHIKDLFKLKYKLPVYYGFGLRMRFPYNSQMYVGVRGTVGLLMYLKKFPIDVFFEIAPSFRLLPTTGLDIDIAIGSRYYFKI